MLLCISGKVTGCWNTCRPSKCSNNQKNLCRGRESHQRTFCCLQGEHWKESKNLKSFSWGYIISFLNILT